MKNSQKIHGEVVRSSAKKRKLILLIAVETDFELMVILGRELRVLGYEVEILIGDRWNLSVRNEYIRKVSQDNEFTLSFIEKFEGLYQNLSNLVKEKNINVDWDYLESFDITHSDGYLLNQVLRSDFAVSNDYHSCDLYPLPKCGLFKYKFLEAHVKLLVNITNDKEYDLMLTVSTQSLLKPILFKISQKKKIPFLTLEENRIGQQFQLYKNFCLGTDDEVVLEMKKLIGTGDLCLDAEKIIDKFLESKGALYPRHNSTISSAINNQGILYLFGKMKWIIKHHLHIMFDGLKGKDTQKIKLGMPTFRSTTKFYFRNFINILKYSLVPEFNENTIPDRKFVYFPLHLMPESNTATQSPELNELSCIALLSQKLPANWQILVKLPPSQFSLEGYTRDIEFFYNLRKIPNVKILSPWVRSYDLLTKCQVVASLAGTALLEGAILGKRGIYWGKPEFEILSSLIHINNFSFEKIDEPYQSNVKQYIQACKNLSVEFDKNIIPSGLIRVDSSEEVAVNHGIRNLLDFMKLKIATNLQVIE